MGDWDEDGQGAREEILTARLLLRPSLPADRPVLAKLSADQAVTETMCEAIALAGGHTFAITERAAGTIIGCAGYGPTQAPPDTIEIGLWIGTPWWGHGYGTEAAQALIDHAFTDERVTILRCASRVTNSRARRMIEKCGFQFRGSGMVCSPAFFGAFPAERFALDRRTWASLKAWGAPRDDHEEAERESAA